MQLGRLSRRDGGLNHFVVLITFHKFTIYHLWVFSFRRPSRVDCYCDNTRVLVRFRTSHFPRLLAEGFAGLDHNFKGVKYEKR